MSGPFVAALLDRLCEGGAERDLARYKEGVARDLEALLNARSGFPGLDPVQPGTILDYGIPDLSSLSLLDPANRAHLAERIEEAVQRFEPRLAEASVTLEACPDLIRSLRFRVDALLRARPGHPPVVFDALVQLATGACRVAQGR